MSHPPLEGRSRALVTLALSLATFMQVLDTTIANVAIPTIAGDLGASTSQGTWVITSFGVANAISVPITGWLAKRVGEVRLFLLATIGFVISSWLCGLAPSLELLILFRVLQGLLAGPMIPLSQSLLLQSYPPDKRAIAMALWTMTIIVAPIFGPILGGWLSDNWHWSWIFYINIPIGAAAAALVWRELRHRETTILQLPIDKVGLILLVLGVGCLQMMLDRGKELDWFHSGEIVLYGIIALLALSYLVVWELTDQHPVIDLSLFRDRNFSVGVISVSVGFMLYFGAIVLMPLLMQTQMGYTATEAGLATAPIGILPVLLSPIIGKNAHRLDMRWVVTFSFLMFAACFYWRYSTFNPAMDFASVAWPQFVQGFAIAGFFMPLTTITLSNMKPQQLASASSLSNFMRTLAGSIGASLTTWQWEHREGLHHTQLTEHVSLYDSATRDTLAAMQQAGLSAEQAAAVIAGDISRQGLFLGANEVFWLATVLFLLLTGLVWLSRPPKAAAGVVVVDAGH
ncbi:DHA2 family efflux MFS transporter permease subunit [Vogesella indigofera]|uniref:DHA2 family efflux MFS transporter permease subunit n=1 Tax=Vogesella indigofera TaxID=45465 RepID=A0ABT5I348_VOGIN|nr:DHA2 family efflux MFS transporter permease subunit [Vogesella indigofera]MDC7690604.1 DHA2 family efflux MFS transporter permease subunit [Vogesella indigofera]